MCNIGSRKPQKFMTQKRKITTDQNLISNKALKWNSHTLMKGNTNVILSQIRAISLFRLSKFPGLRRGGRDCRQRKGMRLILKALHSIITRLKVRIFMWQSLLQHHHQNISTHMPSKKCTNSQQKARNNHNTKDNHNSKEPNSNKFKDKVKDKDNPTPATTNKSPQTSI